MWLEGMFGLLVGLVLGLTGGGGVLAVPALVLGLGYSLPHATPVALIAVGVASFLGSLEGLLHGLVRYKAAALMALGGVFCIPFGLMLARVLPSAVLLCLFSLVLLLVAGRMWRQVAAPAARSGGDLSPARPCLMNPQTGKLRWNRRCVASMATVGGLSGLFSGLLGVGGGFVIVPGVRQVSDISMHSVVATSLMVIALISATTVIFYLASGGTVSAQAWPFIVAAVAGMLGGRVLAPPLPERFLQGSFALLAFFVALLMLIKSGGVLIS